MPTDIMDEYLLRLEKHEQEIIQDLFPPFRFTRAAIEMQRMAESFLLQQDVSLCGVAELVVFGKDATELEEHVAHVREHGEGLVSGMADECLNDDLPSEKMCTFPTLMELRDCHSRYPVFGILLAIHDIECTDCRLEDIYDEEFLEDDRTPGDVIADLSDEEQSMLVAMATCFLDEFKAVFTPEERLPLEVDDPAEIGEAFYQLDWLAAFAKSYTEESFLWMVRHPYFFQQAIKWGGDSPELKLVFGKFEEELLKELPRDVWESYAEGLHMVRGDFKPQLFC